MADKTRFQQQIDFILEIDKVKQIFRQTYLSDEQRFENDAEHSWHLAVMAVLLAEYFPNTDIIKVIKMALIHDLVEIYAGDTYCYDTKGYEDKKDRETAAAQRLYALLPKDQEIELKKLWEEFEAVETPEAKFANILDRIQPLILNFATSGRAWKEHGIYSEQVIKRNTVVLEGPKPIADFLLATVQQAEENGWLKTATSEIDKKSK